MSDSIDRQAALEEIIYEPYYVEMHPVNVINELRDRIKALPCIQPERNCDGCRFTFYAKEEDPGE